MQSVSLQTQEDYVLSFQRGERAGFDWAFRQLYPALTLYVNTIIRDEAAAEEIASDAFIKTWSRHQQFHEWAYIKAYLYRVVHNDALQHLRKTKKGSRQLSELSYLRLNDCEMDHSANLITAETVRLLHKGMANLPAACGEVLQMLYKEGKSVKETAQVLQLSPNTVKAQRRKGLALLRQRLASFFTFL